METWWDATTLNDTQPQITLPYATKGSKMQQGPLLKRQGDSILSETTPRIQYCCSPVLSIADGPV